MLEHERKLQALDITVIVVLFFIGCVIGKFCTNKYGGTWLSFNGPALGTLVIGGLIWWRVRRKIALKWEDKDGKS